MSQSGSCHLLFAPEERALNSDVSRLHQWQPDTEVALCLGESGEDSKLRHVRLNDIVVAPGSSRSPPRRGTRRDHCETLSSALAQGMPYAALCTATSTENSTAKPQRRDRVRDATLHRAEYAKGEQAPRKSPEKPRSLDSSLTRKRWSGARALCTRRADQRFNGGGGWI
jgi:hypothetical protein